MNWKKVLGKAGKGLWISGGAALLQGALTPYLGPLGAAAVIGAIGAAVMGGDNYRKNRKGRPA
jgi:O-antigen/teichoic acid export membrane protein